MHRYSRLSGGELSHFLIPFDFVCSHPVWLRIWCTGPILSHVLMHGSLYFYTEYDIPPLPQYHIHNPIPRSTVFHVSYKTRFEKWNSGYSVVSDCREFGAQFETCQVAWDAMIIGPEMFDFLAPSPLWFTLLSCCSLFCNDILFIIWQYANTEHANRHGLIREHRLLIWDYL